MSNQFVVMFDQNIESLNQIAKEADSIDQTDLFAVKEMHKRLVKIRTGIKAQEKAMVDEANAFRNNVFQKRDEYLAITLPVEEKLKAILEQDEKRRIIEARRILLPSKKLALSTLKIVPPSDDFVLSLDEEGWVEFLDLKLKEHNQIIEKEKREIQIREEEKKNAERRERELLQKAEKEKQEAVKKEREKIEREAEEEKKRKEKALKDEIEARKKRESDKKYQDFLSINSYNEKTDRIVTNGKGIRIYRFVAELILD